MGILNNYLYIPVNFAVSEMSFDTNTSWAGIVDKLTKKQTKTLVTKIHRNKQSKQLKNISRKVEKCRGSETAPYPQTGHSVKSRVEEKLRSSKFRWLNEQLYTQHSSGALKLFTDSPELFSVYHEGFSLQTQKWPVNPLDRIVSRLNSLPADLVVADLGCGEARLALGVEQKVLSFDLVSVNRRVTACDMRDLPLDTASVDISVFCLSLMGTNIGEFLLEAGRILRRRGELIIAEIASRFGDIDRFIASVEQLNFKLVSREQLTGLFVLLIFRKRKGKIGSQTAELEQFSLKPCLYKKR